MLIMDMTGYVLFLYLLGVQLPWGHDNKIKSWYLLGVAFKESDDHPHHFYLGVPPPPPPFKYSAAGQEYLLVVGTVIQGFLGKHVTQ